MSIKCARCKEEVEVYHYVGEDEYYCNDCYTKEFYSTARHGGITCPAISLEAEEESDIPKCARCKKEVGVCYYVFGDADPHCRDCYASAMAGEEWKKVTPEVREKSVQNIASLSKWAAGFWVKKNTSSNRAFLLGQQPVPAGIIIEQNSYGKLDVSYYSRTTKTLIGVIDVKGDGWYHYIVQRNGDSFSLSGEDDTIELAAIRLRTIRAEDIFLSTGKTLALNLKSDLMEETGSIRCIKCEEKIVGTYHYILGNDYAHCEKCHREVSAEIAKACLTTPVVSGVLPELHPEAEKPTSVRCIKCTGKIEGNYFYVPGSEYAHCKECYIKKVPGRTWECDDILQLEEEDDIPKLVGVIPSYLPDAEGEAPLAIFTPNGLIQILNEDKVASDFWHDEAEVNEYVMCDCRKMDPGVYRAVLGISSWQGHEGDWDSELTLSDLHQYDFETHKWLPDGVKGKVMLRMEGESCENCSHGKEEVCTECTGKNYGLQTEIADGFWCENYRTRCSCPVPVENKRFWFAWTPVDQKKVSHTVKFPFSVHLLPFSDVMIYCGIADCAKVEDITVVLNKCYGGEDKYAFQFVEERPSDWTPWKSDELSINSTGCRK